MKRLNKSGVLQELDEHLIDKLVLGYGLDHEHSLLPQVSQHHRNVHLLIVLQAADHQLGQDDHAGPAHPSAAVHHDGRVAGVAAVQHAVGVAAHRLDLLQVR